MGDIIKLNQDEADAAQHFADLVAGGKITHAVATYRTADGDLGYCLVSPEHVTYIVGLMERTKIHLLNLANESQEE